MSLITLTLMRHAKSSWKQNHQSDYDRELNERGHHDAPMMAKRLFDRGSVPQLILSSSAQRTRQTTEHVLSIFGSNSIEVNFDKSLYLASSSVLLNAVLGVSDKINHIMLIAHNPGIEDLSAHLSSQRGDVMPTASIRQFTGQTMDDLQLAADSLRRSNGMQSGSNSIALSFSDYPKSGQGCK